MGKQGYNISWSNPSKSVLAIKGHKGFVSVKKSPEFIRENCLRGIKTLETRTLPKLRKLASSFVNEFINDASYVPFDTGNLHNSMGVGITYDHNGWDRFVGAPEWGYGKPQHWGKGTNHGKGSGCGANFLMDMRLDLDTSDFHSAPFAVTAILFATIPYAQDLDTGDFGGGYYEGWFQRLGLIFSNKVQDVIGETANELNFRYFKAQVNENELSPYIYYSARRSTL